MAALVIYPDRYIDSVLYGLRLFSLSVLPALFPFFFLSKILTSLNVSSSMEKFIKKPLHKFFHSPPAGGYILFVSLMSGYPVGAKLISDCCNSGIITEKQARNISVFTSTSGPLFILGTVGVMMFNNKLAGFIILIAHYLGAVINGLILTSKTKDNQKTTIPPPIDYDNILSDSITSSITAVAIVGGYIAIFGMLIDVLSDFSILDTAAKLLSYLFIPEKIAFGILSSFIEITRGCKILASIGSPAAVVPICAGMISFGGLSITLQSMTFLSKCKIKPLFYLKTKIVQGIITYIVATVLSLIFL
ncbi:MAG: hypothetical protein ACOCWI_00165 [Bacillota bacterium]